MDNIQTFKNFTTKTIRDSVQQLNYSLIRELNDGRGTIVELAAGSSPISLQMSLDQHDKRFIAIDIQKPSTSKLKKFARGVTSENFNYFYGEEYMEIFNMDLNVERVYTFFPLPTASTLKWIGQIISNQNLKNRQTELTIFTEILPSMNDYNYYYCLKYDFVKELVKALDNSNSRYDYQEITFEMFHNNIGRTEFSQILMSSFLTRQGVANINISI